MIFIYKNKTSIWLAVYLSKHIMWNIYIEKYSLFMS